MPATVIVANAGTHHYKLDSRGGQHKADVATLCEMLLNKAGYTKDLTWNLRVEKTLHCSAESRSVRVVGNNHFGVQIRLKATPNATADHQFTLLIPDGSGYNATNLCQQLKANEKSISRHWPDELRKIKLSEQAAEERRKAVPVVPDFEAVPASLPDPRNVVWLDPAAMTPAGVSLNGHHANGQPALVLEPAGFAASVPADDELHIGGDEPRPHFESLAGIHTDPAKLRFVLRQIHTLSLTRIWKDESNWLNALMDACGFTQAGFRSMHFGKALAAIADRSFLTHAFENDRCVVVGYTLTTLGRRVAGGDLDAIKEAPQRVSKPRAPKVEDDGETVRTDQPHPPAGPHLPPPPAKTDYGALLIGFAGKAQDLADAGRRIRAIRTEREGLPARREEIRAAHEKRMVDLLAECRAELEAFDATAKQLAVEEDMLVKTMVAGQESYVLIQRLTHVQVQAPVPALT